MGFFCWLIVVLDWKVDVDSIKFLIEDLLSCIKICDD